MLDDLELYKRAFERERAARKAAEQVVEDTTRELYRKNQKLEDSLQQLREQQRVLVQNEKLATLGTLAAGIAHEINNPMAFVHANLGSLSEYIGPYQELVAMLREALELPFDQQAAAKQKIAQLIKSADLEFFEEELPELMEDTREGLERVRAIIMNLRSFARTHTQEREAADIVAGLKSTLKLLNSQFRTEVTVQEEYQPLPMVICNISEINQVFLNLLVNAGHALEGRSGGTIRIATSVVEKSVKIVISDNGTGMSDEVKEQIFVPFFTTKPVGKGTGMGMSIAYGIVADHGGKIDVDSTLGEGTTFSITLPIDGSTGENLQNS